MSVDVSLLPKFFRLRQSFARPQIDDVTDATTRALNSTVDEPIEGKRVAITAGSRGIANIAAITRACVDFLKSKGALPFIVPAMGSHGGATAAGQQQVLSALGVTEETMGCSIRSSMQVVEVCQAAENFPVYFDQHAFEADHVLVVNRIKPHTRFAGDIESGLMKMMLIGLGKQRGAEVYHQVIHNYSFDQIVRSVAKEVIAKCSILGGLAILENAYEETAAIVGVQSRDIESKEAELLRQVKKWMPRLPFEKSELLMIDRIGKNISGTGMDTNVIGRKKNDHAAIEGELPDIHHIYVRGLTEETHGNASGIGLSELCHSSVIAGIDKDSTRMNCITAGHITGGMHPVDFPCDYTALKTACQLSGYVRPHEITAMWIQDTLHLAEIECSEAFYTQAQNADFEILTDPQSLEFDAQGDLVPRFGPAD
ncbi:MAG: lactate racemase domain-containing protein [Planctomycetota bacterium]